MKYRENKHLTRPLLSLKAVALTEVVVTEAYRTAETFAGNSVMISAEGPAVDISVEMLFAMTDVDDVADIDKTYSTQDGVSAVTLVGVGTSDDPVKVFTMFPQGHAPNVRFRVTGNAGNGAGTKVSIDVGQAARRLG